MPRRRSDDSELFPNNGKTILIPPPHQPTEREVDGVIAKLIAEGSLPADFPREAREKLAEQRKRLG